MIDAYLVDFEFSRVINDKVQRTSLDKHAHTLFEFHATNKYFLKLSLWFLMLTGRSGYYKLLSNYSSKLCENYDASE